MRKTLVLAAGLLFAVSSFAADLTVDDILARNAEARGGMDKLRAVKSLRLSGKMAMMGMEAPITLSQARPDKMRMEFTLQGMTGIQAYDGTTGWMVMPFMGKKDAEAMSGDMLKEVKEQADIDGPFVDYAKKGHKVELLGKADVEGTPAYKVRLLTKDGTDSTVYFDTETFLQVKNEAKRKMQGQEFESQTTFGNYQEVEGLLIPFSIEMSSKAAPAQKQSITIEKAEINPALDDASFKMPAAAPKAETKQ